MTTKKNDKLMQALEVSIREAAYHVIWIRNDANKNLMGEIYSQAISQYYHLIGTAAMIDPKRTQDFVKSTYKID